jgi:hypothetical protein
MLESLMIFDVSDLYNFLSGSFLLVGGEGSGDRFRPPHITAGETRVAPRLVMVSLLRSV